MTTYIIKRHGSNAANQSMTPEMVVGTVEAATRKNACRIARDKWTCYANQYFEAIPQSRASKSDHEAAWEGDQLAELEAEYTRERIAEDARHYREVAKELEASDRRTD